MPNETDIQHLEECLAASKRAHRFVLWAVTLLLVGMMGVLLGLGLLAYDLHVKAQNATEQRAELLDLLKQNCQ